MKENQLTKSTDPTNEDLTVWATHKLRDLANRVNGGDRSALQELRNALDKFPWMSSVLGGNLVYQVETSIISAMYGDQVAHKEALERELVKMREELAGKNPSPIEKLLVERVVTCWLQVHQADLVVAQSKSQSLASGDYHQRRQDRSHKRLLAAIKTLATVRRLALPIQVDVQVAALVKTT